VRITTALPLLAGVLVSTALLACSSQRAAAPASSPQAEVQAEPTPSPAATATPVPPTPTPRIPAGAVPFPAPMREQAERLLIEVAALRQSPPRGEASMFLVSRKNATDYYTPVRDENAPQRTDLREDLYKLLGLVAERVSVAQQDTAYLGSLITGFYASDHNAFYLLDDQGPSDGPKAKSTVVHEFTHLLQDQYYDLDALDTRFSGNWDATRAYYSLLEGDALNTEAHFFGRPLRQLPPCFTLPNPPSGTSYAVARDLDTWYFDGYCFVQAALRQGKTIAELWQRIPSTTEQLLHPEKYLAEEGARPVNLAAVSEALGPGWERQGGSSFGEYQLQNLLQVGLGRDSSRIQRAAAGWGGDAWIQYQNGEQRLLQAATVWDSAEDAAEFFAALSQSLRSRGADLQADGDRLSGNAAGKHWRVRLVGDRVDFAVATDVEALDRAARALQL
jgi:hypothetical protein